MPLFDFSRGNGGGSRMGGSWSTSAKASADGRNASALFGMRTTPCRSRPARSTIAVPPGGTAPSVLFTSITAVYVTTPADEAVAADGCDGAAAAPTGAPAGEVAAGVVGVPGGLAVPDVPVGVGVPDPAPWPEAIACSTTGCSRTADTVPSNVFPAIDSTWKLTRDPGRTPPTSDSGISASSCICRRSATVNRTGV